ncbi:MAG: DegV family protein, partial [Longimicrobiales bacterium]|nr:DegV family protein [Longimicrobiales bacterium]
MQIRYVDGPRLRRSLLAATEYAHGTRAELNRINVFPVPDGDTGTNLVLTVRAIAERLHPVRERRVSVVAREAAEAAVLGARGNCGMMLSHFLLGFAENLGDRERVTAEELAGAFQAGAESLQRALERPVEGTILTVVRDAARTAVDATTSDVEVLLAQVVDGARASLERTPDLLPALRKAGVVDAGAKGFVSLLEGVERYIRGEPLVQEGAGAAGLGGALTGASEVRMPGTGEATPVAAAAARADFNEEEQGAFCTEALVRGPDLPTQEAVRDRLRDRGDSLIVIRTGETLKIHIHTDDPEDVFRELRSMGRLVTHKAEDMREQRRAVEGAAARHVRLARRPVGVVTDTACDLPDEVLRAHGIRMVPLQLVAGDETFQDRLEISAEDFVRRLAGEGEIFTTSQPAPGAFVEAFRDAAE